jgi:anti-sigma B factor antagonist
MEPPPQRPFSVLHHADDVNHVLTVIGDIDIFTTPDFITALDEALGAQRVIVDLTECRYIDSTGISALFRWQQKSKGRIRLVIGPQEMIRRILQVTRVDKLIDIFPSVDAAKA